MLHPHWCRPELFRLVSRSGHILQPIEVVDFGTARAASRVCARPRRWLRTCTQGRYQVGMSQQVNFNFERLRVHERPGSLRVYLAWTSSRVISDVGHRRINSSAVRAFICLFPEEELVACMCVLVRVAV